MSMREQQQGLRFQAGSDWRDQGPSSASAEEKQTSGEIIPKAQEPGFGPASRGLLASCGLLEDRRYRPLRIRHYRQSANAFDAHRLDVESSAHLLGLGGQAVHVGDGEID